MQEFVIDFRLNKNFNHLVAIYFTSEGAGAAVLLTALIFNQIQAMWVGLMMVVIGVACLFFDLGRPYRFWRSMRKPNRSWISRGSLFVAGLIFFAGLYLALPAARNGPVGETLRLISALLCILTVSYTGIFIASFSAVPAWHTQFIPPLFCLQSAATGLIIFQSVLQLAGTRPQTTAPFALAQILILAPALALIYAHCRSAANGSPAEKESVHILTHGEMKRFFIPGAVVTGLVVPLGLAVAAYFGSPAGIWNTPALWVLSALCRAAGDFFYRWSILKSGVYEPIYA